MKILEFSFHKALELWFHEALESSFQAVPLEITSHAVILTGNFFSSSDSHLKSLLMQRFLLGN
jgi:hypothetical protein